MTVITLYFFFHISNPLNVFNRHKSQYWRGFDVFLHGGLNSLRWKREHKYSPKKKKKRQSEPPFTSWHSSHAAFLGSVKKFFQKNLSLPFCSKPQVLDQENHKLSRQWGEAVYCDPFWLQKMTLLSCLTCLMCAALCQFTSHSVTHGGTQETSRNWRASQSGRILCGDGRKDSTKGYSQISPWCRHSAWTGSWLLPKFPCTARAQSFPDVHHSSVILMHFLKVHPSPHTISQWPCPLSTFPLLNLLLYLETGLKDKSHITDINVSARGFHPSLEVEISGQKSMSPESWPCILQLLFRNK